MRAIGQAHGSTGAADFLHGDDMREIAHADAAIGFADGDAVEAEIAEFLPKIMREGIAAIDLPGAGRDFGGRESGDTAAQHVEGFAECKIQALHQNDPMKTDRLLWLPASRIVAAGSTGTLPTFTEGSRNLEWLAFALRRK